MTTRVRETTEYRANRRAILDVHPVCAICHQRPATTVDHIVPRNAGGDDSLANLRPACVTCNSRRGAAGTNAKKALKRAVTAEVFGGDPSREPGHFRSISGRNGPSSAGSTGIVGRVPEKGRNAPRLATPKVGDGSWGPQVVTWAKRNLPHAPMAWNRAALKGLLSTERGELCHRAGLISVARQNSKTQGIGIPLAGWWLDEHADRVGPQVVTWTAHDLRLAELAYFQLAALLEHRIVRASSSYGRQRFELDNGSRFHVQPNTLGAGHGLSIDLAVVDELWRVKVEAVDHGLSPAQRARPSPLMVCLSTAGDEESQLLKSWRERALTIIETGAPGRLFMAEWSPPPGVDYAEARWWSWANPALGTTIDGQTLTDEWLAPNRASFLRAALNLWVQSDAGWLEPGAWARCQARTMPDPEGGTVAAEVSQGGDRFVAVRAWCRDGITYTTPLVVTEHEDKLWAELEAVYGMVDTLAVTPTLEPHLPLEMRRKTTTVGIKELARWVPLVRSMLLAGQVAHDGDILLGEHVGRAVATRQAGLSTAHSAGPIEAARCLVWAVALASRPAWRTKPALGFSADLE